MQHFELRPDRRLHQLGAGRASDCIISRMISRVCQVSSGPVRTRRMNVVMKSASFFSRRRVGRPLGQLRLFHPPAMRSHDRLDIQPLLVAEVVIHGGNIRLGRLADVADRRGVEAASRQRSRPPRRRSVRGLYLNRLVAIAITDKHCFKQLFQSIV